MLGDPGLLPLLRYAIQSAGFSLVLAHFMVQMVVGALRPLSSQAASGGEVESQTWRIPAQSLLSLLKELLGHPNQRHLLTLHQSLFAATEMETDFFRPGSCCLWWMRSL